MDRGDKTQEMKEGEKLKNNHCDYGDYDNCIYDDDEKQGKDQIRSWKRRGIKEEAIRRKKRSRRRRRRRREEP